MDGLNAITPELAHIEHVGLVHGAEAAPPLDCKIKAHLGDPIDFVVRVGHGVEGAHMAIGLHPALGGAEVNAAGELPHHHQVNPLDHLALEAAGIDQGRNDFDRPQVGEEAKPCPEAEQARFGPLFARQAVVLGAANRSEQNRIGAFAGFQGACGERVAGGIDG